MRDVSLAVVVTIVVVAVFIFGLATPRQPDAAPPIETLRPAAAPIAPQPEPASVTAFRPDDEIDFEQLRDLHAYYRTSFVEAEGFGERRIVHMPTSISNRKTAMYIAKDLDLIGFMQAQTKEDSLEQLSHTEALTRAAVVYDFPTLRPKRKMIKQAAKRTLTHFERRAIQRIVAGEEIVAEVFDGKVRAVGALRATQDCAECHKVKENTLLGAFSYEFHESTQLQELIDIISKIKTDQPVEKAEVDHGKELIQKTDRATLRSLQQVEVLPATPSEQ